jgi:hypothetical protein
MAITTGQVIVTTGTAVQLDTSSVSNFKMILHNMSATDNIFLGNANVTAATGLELHNHSYITFEMQPNDALFAISSGGSHDLGWMKIH